MKKNLIYLFAFLSVFIFIGCPGNDGEDGRAFITISYSQTQPHSYWDNNPGIPYGMHYGIPYQSESGIYDFEYFVTVDRSWVGTYEIYINHGGKGRDFFRDGKDGDDTYLTILCDPDGPVFERYSEPHGTFGSLDVNSIDLEDDFGRFSIRIRAKQEFNQHSTVSPKAQCKSR